MAGLGSLDNIAGAGARSLDDRAGAIVNDARGFFGGIDTREIANEVADLAGRDPQAAARLLENIEDRLSPSQRQNLTSDLADAMATRQRQAAQGDLPPGLTPEQRELILDLGQIGLDIAGLVDPTPISDGVNGVISLFRGDLLGAGISAVSMVPYIGDAAKIGKFGKWAQTVVNAAELAARNSDFARTAMPILERIGASIDAIPRSVLNNLPASATAKLDEISEAIDTARTNVARRFGGEATETAARREVIELEGGRKGAWNSELNGPLRPDTDYLVNGYTYKTDGQGRITEVSGELDLSTADRNTYQQRKAGDSGIDGDDGGHIVASIFNGPGEMINLYPQNGNFNRGVWKQLENTWAEALENGSSVNVKIELNFADDGVRPSGVTATYQIDGGRPVRETFDNVPGGGR